VDDRDGTKPRLTPALYQAILDEAHKFNVPVAAHNVTLADAKALLRGGIEGWLHVPVRGGDEVDSEIIQIVKDRIAKNDRPNLWMTPALAEPFMSSGGGTHPAWLDDPLLHDTYSSEQIQQFWGDPLIKMPPQEIAKAKTILDGLGRNARKLRAAGIKVVMGTDTGQSRFFIGYSTHMDLEGLVAIGLTPSEAIVAATKDAAEVAHFPNMGRSPRAKRRTSWCWMRTHSTAFRTREKSTRFICAARKSIGRRCARNGRLSLRRQQRSGRSSRIVDGIE
jgi:imidazolonepropionase-like amidohydrolase